MEFDNSIEFFYWAWKSKIERTATQKVYKIIKKEKIKTTPKEAIATFENMLIKYLNHCGKIRAQRNAITSLKENLSPSEAIIHVDFSENYKCQFSREIQAVHFGGSKQQISLHTSVLYYFDVNQVKVTKCYATASTNTRHDAAAVWAHLMPLLEFIQKHAPSTTTLHVISDSAGSQYRNLKMYFIITALHWSFTNIEHITWNFTEAGHGKGAPDGVGAVLKRSANNLVKCGKDIPDLTTFVELLKEHLNNVIIDTVSEYAIFEKDLLLPKNLQHFKGTQKVHQIVWNLNKKAMVALRILSCTESSCRILANRCPHGNHLSFHEPLLKALPRVRILSDVLIRSAYQESISNSTFVASPIRSPAFSALSELELPSELQRSSLDNILAKGYDDKENIADNVIEQSDSSDSFEIFPRMKKKHEF
ncbi:unnamed protein product [Colias eurytheme]|nr:unnamed protein product [Colias eurytheme]